MTAQDELVALLGELGAHELLVLAFLARRLREGQRAYGEIDLERDPRDFERERAAELGDAIVYTAFAELRRVLTNGSGPR